MPKLAELALAIAALTGCVVVEPPPSPGPAEDVRRVIATLDDVAGDYPGAANDRTRLAVLDHLLHDAGVQARYFPAEERARLHEIARAVADREPAAPVVAAARQLRRDLLASHQVVMGPAAPPPRRRAEQLWDMVCAGCHGAVGAGDGPQGLYLVPEPKDFHDAEFMATLSPSRAFSRITDGMAGTDMPSWGTFSTAERWALAGHVFSLRHDDEAVARGARAWPRVRIASSFGALADRSDGEIVADLRAQGLDEATATDVLAFLRAEVAFAIPGGPLADVRAGYAAALHAHEARRWAEAAAGFAAARRRLGRALDAIRAADPLAAARLEERHARLDDELATRGLHEALAKQVIHVDRWLDRAEDALRAPRPIAGARLALTWAAAAALGLGMLLARRRAGLGPAALGAVAGTAGAGALVPGSAAAAILAIAVAASLAIALASPAGVRDRVTLAAAGALVGVPLGAIARAQLGLFGAAGLVVIVTAATALALAVILGRLVPRAVAALVVPIALAIAAAASLGRGAWTLASADGVAPRLALGWRVETLGLYPDRAALAAAAVGAVLVGLAAARQLVTSGAARPPIG